MSYAVTFDDFDKLLNETEEKAKTVTSSAAVESKPITGRIGLSRTLWSLSKNLKRVNDLFSEIDLRQQTGMACQMLETKVQRTVDALQLCVEACRKNGLFNSSFTAGSLRAIETQLDRTRDMWVALNSSTDSELEEELTIARKETSVDWETIWR